MAVPERQGETSTISWFIGHKVLVEDGNLYEHQMTFLSVHLLDFELPREEAKELRSESLMGKWQD